MTYIRSLTVCSWFLCASGWLCKDSIFPRVASFFFLWGNSMVASANDVILKIGDISLYQTSELCKNTLILCKFLWCTLYTYIYIWQKNYTLFCMDIYVGIINYTIYYALFKRAIVCGIHQIPNKTRLCISHSNNQSKNEITLWILPNLT